MKKVLMPKWFKFLIIITLVLGIFFRFANLDQKVYSADEVRSILRLSGYSSPEFIEEVFTGDIITANEIQQYQIPTSNRNLGDAINALKGVSAHPPLYHLLTRFWMQLFNTPIAARIFSIILSIIVFPCLYWLCLELFGSPLFGWVAIAIVAISPFHIHAAQNTTQYSLWAVTILLSSTTLLKALRSSNKPNWLLYALTVATGLYTHLFFVIVAFSHGLYVLILEKFRITKNLINYCLASIAGLLIFSPWIILIVSDLEEVRKSTAYYGLFDPTFKRIMMRFLSNVGNVFIDFHHTTRIEKYLDYLVFLIIGYSIYMLCSNTQRKVWLFILILIVVTPMVHILPSFISPSARPLQSRYYLPCYLGIELSVTYLIGYSLSVISLPRWKINLGKIIFILTLSLGIISGIFITKIHDWGLDDQKGTANGRNLQLAPIINQAEQPLIISEATHSFILGLSYLVDGQTKFLLLKDKDLKQWQKKLNFSETNQKFKDIFIYFPDQTFIDFLESNHHLQLELIKKGLYKINRSN